MTTTNKPKRRPDIIVYAPEEGRNEKGYRNSTKAGVGFLSAKGNYTLLFGEGTEPVRLIVNQFKDDATDKDGNPVDPKVIAKRPDFQAVTVDETNTGNPFTNIGAAWKTKSGNGLRIDLAAWGQKFVAFEAGKPAPKIDPETGEVLNEKPLSGAPKAAPQAGMTAGA